MKRGEIGATLRKIAEESWDRLDYSEDCALADAADAADALLVNVERLKKALEAYLHLIGSEFWCEKSKALDGHPISKDARKEWDMGWAAIKELEE